MLSWYQRVQSVPRTPIHHHLNCWYKADGAMFSCFYTNFWPELHSRYQDLSDRTMFFCFFCFCNFLLLVGPVSFQFLTERSTTLGGVVFCCWSPSVSGFIFRNDLLHTIVVISGAARAALVYLIRYGFTCAMFYDFRSTIDYCCEDFILSLCF